MKQHLKEHSGTYALILTLIGMLGAAYIYFKEINYQRGLENQEIIDRLDLITTNQVKMKKAIIGILRIEHKANGHVKGDQTRILSELAE